MQIFGKNDEPQDNSDFYVFDITNLNKNNNFRYRDEP